MAGSGSARPCLLSPLDIRQRRREPFAPAGRASAA